MALTRRSFLSTAAITGVSAMMPASLRAQTEFAPRPGRWRSFEVTTLVRIAEGRGSTQAWIPLATTSKLDWFRDGGARWSTNGRVIARNHAENGAGMLHVQWSADEAVPFVEVTNQISTLDRAVDLTASGHIDTLSPQERRHYLSPTEFVPIDGIVKRTSDAITGVTSRDVDKGRAIFEWIVEHGYRRASTRGCGNGDIVAMLKSEDLGGKCADLNALLVGLARAAGIPARDAYGIRVAPSQFGYRSLGANSETITAAQHCRAELYFDGLGWTPVDPADVLKVRLEEPPGNLGLDEPKVAAARRTLFGAWEGNWLAYNFAHDVILPGSDGARVPFLMYPQAEVNGARIDCLDAAKFQYEIKAKEITSI